MTALAFSIFPMLVPAIEAAKKLGHRVICIHHNKARERYALNFVDQFYHVGPYKRDDLKPHHHRNYIDLNRVIEICKKEEVEYILPSPCGSEAIEIGILNEELKLPGLKYEQSLTCVDKIKFFEFLKKIKAANTPQVSFTLKESHFLKSQEIPEFPLFLKPDQGSYSENTYFLKNEQELWSKIDELKKQNNLKYRHFILQKALSGPNILMEVIVHGGRPIFHCMREVLIDEEHLLGYGSIMPPNLSAMQIKEIANQAFRILDGLEVRHGVFALDFILSPIYGPVCIDANPRPSGSGPAMIKLSYDLDMIESIIRLRAGQEVNFPNQLKHHSGYSLLRLPPGKISHIKYPPQQKDRFLHRGSFDSPTDIGTVVPPKRDISNNRERVYAKGDSQEEVVNKIQSYITGIDVRYDG